MLKETNTSISSDVLMYNIEYLNTIMRFYVEREVGDTCAVYASGKHWTRPAVRRHGHLSAEIYSYVQGCKLNTLRMGSFKLFKRPFPGFLTILTL